MTGPAPRRSSCGAASNARVVRIGDEYRNQLVDTGHRRAHRRSRRDGRARHQGACATRSCGRRSRRKRPNELDFSLARRAADASARARHPGHRRPRPSRLGAALHQPARPEFPGPARRLCAARSRERYPWIDAWTPVNEPLTTARFSCLYGHWYPHLRDIDATLPRARQPVPGDRAGDAGDPRASIPAAQLIVRPRTSARPSPPPPLAYQAEHENERRWLTFDLLAGRVVAGHPFHRWLRNKAATRGASSTSSRPATATPDIIGFDHYLTSERFLDHRVERYPGRRAGRRTAATRYVDVEAVRVARLRDAARPGAAAARGVGALRHPDRHHRGPSRLHPRRAGALARTRCGARPSRRAPTAPTSAR